MKTSIPEDAIAFQESDKIRTEENICQKKGRRLREAIEVIIQADNEEIEKLPRRERIEAKKIRGMIQ